MTDARSRTPQEYIRSIGGRRWGRGRILLVGVIGALMIIASLIYSAYAAGQGADPVEGESFSKPSGTEVVTGNQYSGGKALKITSGKALPTKRVTITETSNVLVRARAGQKGGSPTLTIRVDGENAGTRRITSSVLSNYLYSGIILQPGTYTIGLKGGDLAQGRYVFVDVVRFPAVTPTGGDPPVAVADTATVGEDSSATTINVLANDTDPDGGTKTIASVTQPANGTVAITGGGSGLTYKPNADYCNGGSPTDDFTYTLNGGSTATVSVTVTCVDDDPVAVDDTKSVAEDDPATTIDVLNNDTDVDSGPKTIESVTQPQNGTVAITNNGADLTYKPNADYCNGGSPTDDFTYTLNGGSEAKVSVTVTCVEDAPVAVDDNKTVAEDANATALNVLNNDTDPDGDPKTIESVTQPANGTVEITGGGSDLTYKPNANYCNDNSATDDFTYTLNGGSEAKVSVTVTCVDDDPVAVDDTKSVAEDDPATTIDVLNNDTDIDGGSKTIESVTQPANGTVNITNNGNDLTYTPDENYCNENGEPDTFTYTLNGGSTANVDVTVTCVDDDPVAVNDTKTVAEDDLATTIDVLANDTDPDGGTMTIESVTQPQNGTVEITNGGADLTYEPDANYCNDAPGTNADTFTYTLNGGSTANVDVTVTCVEDDPVAVNDSATKEEDSGATAIDVLANDTDVDGGTKTISSVTQPTNGTVAITNGGADLTYEPNADYCNENGQPDTFTYTLNGGSTANVDVTVTCVDDTPVAVDDTKTVAEDDPATTIDVLNNDTDTDGGPKTIESVTQSQNGTVAITNNGNDLTYKPNADYCNDNAATDDFTYKLNGGSEAKVSVTVTCVDDAAVAVNDNKTVAEDDPATTIDVLANDTDPDGGTKTIESVTQPQNGTVAITNNGNDLTYKPNADYCNENGQPDTFTYTLNGGSTATVAVTVTCVDDNPVAVNDSATKAEDSGATAIDVLANDTDVDGGSKTISSVTQPTNGTVVVTGGGSGLTYEPDANYCNDPPATNLDTFTYTLSPGGSTATVSVKVTCVDDAPVAVNDSETVLEDAAATNVPVLTNDTDIDGGPKTISSASDPANGTVVVTGGGSGLTYKPDANYCNDPGDAPDDTFTYTLSPGGSTATVSMKVTCVNDAPTAGNETFSGAIHNTSFVVNDPSDAAPNVGGAKKSIIGDVLSNDSDVETPGSISVVANTNITSTNGGKVAIESDGDFTYVSDPADNCSPNSDTFNYTVTDNDPAGAQTAQGTVTINLSGCVWYVDNDPAETGNAGTSADPFDALSSAQAKSVANQTVFVHKGTSNYTGGFNLDANERLIGEAVNLVVGGDTLFTGTPANRPSLSGTVNLNSGNTISGLAIAGSGTPAIAGGSGDNSGTIADVTLSGGSGGLDLNTTSGTWNLSDLIVNTTGGDAIRAASAGTVNFTSAGTISVTAAAGRGLNLSGTATSGVIDTTTVTSSANEGIRVDDDTGLLTLDDVNLTTTGTGLDIDSSNDVTVNSSGDADISSAGTAVSLTTATSNPSNMPDVTLDQVGSTGGATGINIDDIGNGTFSANGGTLSGHTGAELDVNNGIGNITYPGTIGNGSGLSAQITGRSGGTITLSGNINDSVDAGGGIDMSSNSGGTMTFSGATKTLNTGASPAFSSTGSNPTITLSGGGLNINTTSGAGLSATGGGTVSVGTGANPNTITTTTTGTALNVANTTIGASGLTFRSISAGPASGTGPTNGIVLSNTGTSSGLTVTGNGGTCTNAITSGCSGGVIQNTTGADNSGTTPPGTGIVLNNTRSVSLTRMHIHDHQNYGIRGTSVTGFTLADSVLNGTNGTSDVTNIRDSSVRFVNLGGTVSVTNDDISGGYTSNFTIDNDSGALSSTFTGNDFGSVSTTGGDDSLHVIGTGTSDVDATVQTSTFNSARGDIFQYAGNGTGGGDLAFTGNTVTNTHPAIATGGGGITISGSAAGPETINVSNNTMRDAHTNALTIVKSQGSGSFTGTISNNQIGDFTVPLDQNAGSLEGAGIEVTHFGGGSATLNITNNQIRQYNSFGMSLVAGAGIASSGQFNFNISGNTLSNPGTNPNITLFQGIGVNSGVTPGDTFQTCVNFGANSIAGSGSNSITDSDFRMRARQNTTVRLPGYAGGLTDTAAVVAFAESKIGGGAQGTAAAFDSGTFIGTGTTCP